MDGKYVNMREHGAHIFFRFGEGKNTKGNISSGRVSRKKLFTRPDFRKQTYFFFWPHIPIPHPRISLGGNFQGQSSILDFG